MFNNQNSGSNSLNVNTRVFTFLSDTSMLTVGYWDKSISIKLNPASGKDANNFTVYDRDKKISTAIVAEKSMALLEGINNHITPAIRKVAAGGVLDKPLSVSIEMANKTGRLAITYANDENGVPSVYLIIYKNGNETGRYSDEYGFKFNKTALSYNFDASTGRSDIVNSEAEFTLFTEILKTSVNILGEVPHSMRYNTEFTSRYSRPSGNNTGSFGSMPTYSNSARSEAPVQNYSDMADGDDIPF